MKKFFTVTTIILVVMTLLLAGSALVLSHFVNPNKFKGKISQYVYAKTGQVLVINGNMQWSIFPWVGLKAKNLTYYNSPNFTPKIFVAAKEMDIKIKLIALFTGKIEVGNITLNSAVINLIKNNKGEFNWHSLTKEDKKVQISNEKSANKYIAISNLSIASLKIKNGKLNWHDQLKRAHTTINAVNIHSKDIQFGKPFPFSLQFTVMNEKEKNLSLNLNTDITMAPNYKQFRLQDIKINGEYFHKANKLDIRADGDLTTDLQKQSLVTNLNFVLNGIQGNLNLHGNRLGKTPHFQGTLTTNEFDGKQLLADLGYVLTTKNSDALKTISILGNLDITNSVLQVTQFHAKIDHTDVYGNVQLFTDNKNLGFNLTANQINLSDYLSNKEHANPSVAPSNESPSPQEQDDARVWATHGTINISNLIFDKLKLAKVKATLDVGKNSIRLAPLQADLYQGQLDGNILIDKHQPDKTAVYIKQSLKNINIKQLLHEFSGSEKLSGVSTITADLVSITDANTNFTAGLHGKVQLSLTNGSMQGVDVIYQLSRAHAFIKRLPSPSITDSKKTVFSALTANAVINKGIIASEDFALTSEYLKVKGKGSTNLLTKDIHYRLNALAQPKLAIDNKQIGHEVTVYQVPIKVSGKLNKPSVNLDFVELAKTFYAKEIEKSIPKHLGSNIHIMKDIKEQVHNKIKEYSATKLMSKLREQP